jgi:beta-fructofuranosidase
MNWEILPDAISPSDSPAFDSWTTWTGSVVKDASGKWWMFYTGSSREDGGNIQTIGAATSSDLLTWKKISSQPLLIADSRWYEKLADETWVDEGWRDPWVYWSNQGQLWHMLITARSKSGENQYRGVLGHAVSSNLLDWDVREPISSPNQGFAQQEVFQFEIVDGVPILVFCCGWREQDESVQKVTNRQDRTFSLVCDQNLTNVDFNKSQPFPDSRIYAGRLVKDKAGDWNLLGFINEVDGEFVGEICDPIPVTATSESGLIPKNTL